MIPGHSRWTFGNTVAAAILAVLIVALSPESANSFQVVRADGSGLILEAAWSPTIISDGERGLVSLDPTPPSVLRHHAGYSVVAAKIAIPPDGSLAIRVLSQTSAIIPGPPPQEVDGDLPLTVLDSRQNIPLSDLKPVPAADVQVLGWLGDVRIGAIKITPASYLGNEEWRVITSMRLAVDFVGASAGIYGFHSSLRNAPSGLLNPEWVGPFSRKTDSSIMKVASHQGGQSLVQRERILIEVLRDGMHRIAEEEFSALSEKYNIDWESVDPRTFSISHDGKERYPLRSSAKQMVSLPKTQRSFSMARLPDGRGQTPREISISILTPRLTHTGSHGVSP